MTKFEYNELILHFNHPDRDYIARQWKKGRFYEHRLLDKIKSLNLQGTYVDIGAHHGNHSVFFDKFCNSKKKVISIEGNPFNFNYLKENTTLNNCNCLLYNDIISDKQGETLAMGYSSGNTGMSHVLGKADINHKTRLKRINNTTNTLDNILKNEEKISLIKLDIENYEYFALLGGEEIISKHHPVIVIELHKGSPHYDDIKKFLKKHNYKTDGRSYAISPTFIYH